MSAFLEFENNNIQKQRYVLFKSIDNNSELISIVKSSFPSYHPYKGLGRIIVPSYEALSQAKLLLIEHMKISESYFNEIYPEYFISCFFTEEAMSDFSLVELGKFEIKELDIFLSLLLDKGILSNYSFS